MEISSLRKEFPMLARTVHGKPLVYLDNAATSLAPRVVQERVAAYFSSYTANIHRGVHYLSEETTRQFEETRGKVQRFINAEHPAEIVFTSGTTMSLNLFAQSFAQKHLQRDDEIIITEMEHHSNIVPWQMVCQQRGCVLRHIPLTPTGELDMHVLPSLFTERTKLVSVVHVSNSLGTINPLPEIIAEAKKHGVPVMVDAAQAVAHFPIDVCDLNCDFLAFSSHKMFGTTGVGVLYGKRHLLEELPPTLGGGGMIARVSLANSTYLHTPEKFEAGTPNIAGVLGFDSAMDFFSALDYDVLHTHEQKLADYAIEVLQDINEVTLIGTARERVGIISFTVKDIHPHDLGTVLDHEGVAIRTGHHCTQPTMDFFGVPATARVSLAFYNTIEEIDVLATAIHKALRFFK